MTSHSLNDDERLALAKRVIELYSTGEYTLENACLEVGIKSRSTFYAYVYCRFPVHLVQSYKDAKKKIDEIEFKNRTGRALSGLDKLLDTHQETEIKTTSIPVYKKDITGNIVTDKDGIPIVDYHKVKTEEVTKKYMPNVSAIKYHLNTSETRYQDKPKDNPDIPIDSENPEDPNAGKAFYTLPDGNKIYF